MPYVRKIRDAVATHVAALPVPYRTTEEEPTFQSLTEKDMNSLLHPGRPVLPRGARSLPSDAL